MTNDFCHIELNTDDVGKVKEFYGGLFAWQLQDVPMGDHGTYTMIKPGSGPGGGIQKKPMPEAPSMWLTYIAVESVDATLEKAQKLGGKVIVPKTPIPDMGWLGIVADPTGAVFGVWCK